MNEHKLLLPKINVAVAENQATQGCSEEALGKKTRGVDVFKRAPILTAMRFHIVSLAARRTTLKE